MKITPYRNKLSRKDKLARFAWNIVWCLCFRTNPSWCLKPWRVLLLRMFGAKIGKACSIYPSCKIWAPWNIELGDYVCLASNVNCYSVAPIVIGNKVAVSQGAFLCTASHDIVHPDNPLIFKPIVIGSFSWIAANAFVGLGVTIGEGAVVGACAVVTKDVAPWTVVAGNPAKFIKKRELRNGQ